MNPATNEHFISPYQALGTIPPEDRLFKIGSIEIGSTKNCSSGMEIQTNLPVHSIVLLPLAWNNNLFHFKDSS
jgi:hypothetical protein